MDKDKKQVIPRSQYRRERREFFYNEEREERIKQEQESKLKQAAKEQKQSRVNEERVKDNLRKARIEKLTQDDIQQQNDLAKDRQQNDREDIKEKSLENDTNGSIKKDLEDSITPHDVTTANKTQHRKIKADNQSESKLRTTSNEDQPQPPKNDSSTLNGEKQSESMSKSKSSDKTLNQSNELEKDDNTNSHHDNNECQQTVSKIYEDNLSKSRSQSSRPKKSTSQNHNTFNHIKSVTITFFKEHWPKLLIIVGIILLLLILNAIFTTVNKNDHTNDSAFDGTNKGYTNTMKNANNTVKSVVTVENDLSNNTTAPQNKAGFDNEIGSGVVYKKVDDSIYILTNAHVVGDKENQKITYSNDKSVIGKVIGKDKWSDIAVVKAKVADNNIQTITMGDSNNLKLGESLLVAGNPLGTDFKGSVSQGIISGLNRRVPVDIDKDDSYDVLMKAFQIDAPVNPGNSGGAVVDSDGRLIGIVSLKIDMKNVEGMAFAIPINDVRKIAQQLEDKGKVTYPNTGIKIKNVADMSDSEKDSINLPSKVNNGVVIGEVQQKGLGEKSGLQSGDVIVELDGKTIEDNLRYRQIIFSHKDDLRTLTAKIYRNGTEKNIKIKLK